MNQITIGTKIESEHKETVAFIKSYFQEHKKLPSNKEIYKHIAENHVDEISDYYTRLIEMEKQVKADKKRTPQTRRFTPSRKKRALIRINLRQWFTRSQLNGRKCRRI